MARVSKVALGHVGLAQEFGNYCHATESVDLNTVEKKFICCGKGKGKDFKGVEAGKTVACWPCSQASPLDLI